MRPKIDEATLALGELACKRFNEYNEETEYGFRVRLNKLLAKDLKKVKVRHVSKDLDVVEIIE